MPLIAALALTPFGVAGQTSVKLEAGLGVGGGNISTGLALRGALAIESGGWGGILRSGGHAGESTCDPCLFGIPNPEVVREVAVLARRGLSESYPAKVSLWVGVGIVSGERDDPADPSRLIDIPRSVGAAFELLWDFGDRSGWGAGLAVQGNLNGESSFIGLVFFGSVRIGGGAN
jgi:hypothetical protein